MQCNQFEFVCMYVCMYVRTYIYPVYLSHFNCVGMVSVVLSPDY